MFREISFNKPYCSGVELENIQNAITKEKICGDGFYTKNCNKWFEKNLNRKTLLTNSCTAALEMSAILLDGKSTQEVIMPSYTFVSTANAFVLRGLKPVFVDIKPDTLNIDENLIEQAITDKTKAIVPVHYAGVGCEMDKICSIAKKYNLRVIEDAAQGFGATYKGKHLGTIGDLGTYSFHETKNIVSGEGGALIINNKDYDKRAEIIREKGTNRTSFLYGEVDKYTWLDIGSSFLPSDIIAAYLYAQLEKSKEITEKRLLIWNKYHQFFEKYEKTGIIKRPSIPNHCQHNGHMYYILFNDPKVRPLFIKFLKECKISTVFHYIPLHSSVGGKKFCRTASDMTNTDRVSASLLRLPMFYQLNNDDIKYITEKIDKFMEKL